LPALGFAERPEFDDLYGIADLRFVFFIVHLERSSFFEQFAIELMRHFTLGRDDPGLIHFITDYLGDLGPLIGLSHLFLPPFIHQRLDPRDVLADDPETHGISHFLMSHLLDLQLEHLIFQGKIFILQFIISQVS
jgi:hypothetical protein